MKRIKRPSVNVCECHMNVNRKGILSKPNANLQVLFREFSFVCINIDVLGNMKADIIERKKYSLRIASKNKLIRIFEINFIVVEGKSVNQFGNVHL